MSDKSRIEWTDATWNPITGCSPVSAGCANCYAKRMVRRFPTNHNASVPTTMAREEDFREVRFHPSRLDVPLHWKKPRRIFIGSMTDLFHKDVQDGYRKMIEGVIADCPQHTFMMLTKRADNMREYFDGNLPYANLWLGVTVEGPETLHRMDGLRKIKKATRFVSFEPLLADPGKVDLAGISWVIVGGETGPGARFMHPDWPRSLRDQCVSAGAPFFFKGWGTRMMKKSDPGYMEIDGREWRQFPQ